MALAQCIMEVVRNLKSPWWEVPLLWPILSQTIGIGAACSCTFSSQCKVYDSLVCAYKEHMDTVSMAEYHRRVCCVDLFIHVQGAKYLPITLMYCANSLPQLSPPITSSNWWLSLSYSNLIVVCINYLDDLCQLKYIPHFLISSFPFCFRRCKRKVTKKKHPRFRTNIRRHTLLLTQFKCTSKILLGNSARIPCKMSTSWSNIHPRLFRKCLRMTATRWRRSAPWLAWLYRVLLECSHPLPTHNYSLCVPNKRV